MSNPKVSDHLSFLRWNLNPSSAALWKLASQQACQGLDLRTSWFDVEHHWNPILKSDSESLGKLQKSIGTNRPNALIIGIDRSNVAQIAGGTYNLRQLCQAFSCEPDDSQEATGHRTFLIGWYPQADRESIRIFRELGFDLVLHNPSRLRQVLAKVARDACRSTK